MRARLTLSDWHNARALTPDSATKQENCIEGEKEPLGFSPPLYCPAGSCVFLKESCHLENTPRAISCPNHDKWHMPCAMPKCSNSPFPLLILSITSTPVIPRSSIHCLQPFPSPLLRYKSRRTETGTSVHVVLSSASPHLSRLNENAGERGDKLTLISTPDCP